MPIFDQGYQHWEGKPHGLAWRWWAITWRGVKTQFRNRWTRIIVMLSLSPSLALLAVLIIWGLMENQVSFVKPLLDLFAAGMPPEFRQSPVDFRTMVWSYSFYFFFMVQLTFALILVALVGPDLISKDLRFNAMPLYFSRPLRRFDYFLGKLGVIGFYISLVTLFPSVIAYFLGVLFSLDFKIFQDTYYLLLGSIAFSLVVILSTGMLMLAISSLSRNSRIVTLSFLGFWFISSGLSGLMAVLAKDVKWAAGMGYTSNLIKLCDELIHLEPAHQQYAKLEAQIKQMQKQMQQANPMAGMATRTSPRRTSNEFAVRMDNGRDETAPIRMPQPWYVAAGILVGLFGLSLWTLTTRVKSLDRLK